MSSGLDEVVRNLRGINDRQRAAVIALADTWAGSLEAKAKQEARWRDRTSHARQGLTGQVIGDRDAIVIVLAHSVWYGLWLERARNGQYAILNQIRDAHSQEIYDSFKRLVTGGVGG